MTTASCAIILRLLSSSRADTLSSLNGSSPFELTRRRVVTRRYACIVGDVRMLRTSWALESAARIVLGVQETR